MDLSHVDGEPFAAAISICVVDSGYDPGADPTQVRHQTQRDIGGPPIGTNQGLTCQNPLSRAFEQDASLIKQYGWSVNFPNCERWRRRSVPVIFFSDESGVRSIFMLARPGGYAWQDPGCCAYRQTVSSQHAIGHLGQRRIAVHDLAQGAFRQGCSSISCGDWSRIIRERYFWSWMACRRTKPSPVRQFLAGVKDRIGLFFCHAIFALPDNPDELVWNDVKNNGVGRALSRNARDLYRAVNSRLRLLQNNPDKVHAFFQMDTLAMPPHGL